MKNSLGLGRLRVHSQQAMENTITNNGSVLTVSVASNAFVEFISLILSSHIHLIMPENDLYKTKEKLRTQVIDNRRMLFPLTKQQKNIYNVSSVPLPE